VLLAIALVRALGGRRLRFSIEVVAFSEEEGVRFGVPFIGSRALVGRLDDELLGRKDARGVTVAQAIRDFGLDEVWTGQEACPTVGYLEFHIEQGPVLDSLGLPLGVVTGIVGQSRFEVTFRGAANHAGTTPMQLRRDALTASARWISLVERIARATPGVVATVGALHVHPGATNVVPGEVRASLDVRHADDAVRLAVTGRLRCAAEKIGGRRNVAVEWRQQLDQAAVACDPGLTAMLARAVQTIAPVHHMTSGAGHDAMIVAAIAPIAMLFLRSPGGVSHHPAECVHAADVEAALATGLAFLEELERSHV
jgi:allantoate deiminase